MFRFINSKIKRSVNTDHQRTRKVRINIIFSFFIKGGSILIGFLLVKITINYIDPIQYGIWMTISSITSWLSFFDIGMGNGLRNKLTYSIGINDVNNSKKYISTTYAVITIMSFCLLVIFLAVTPLINWNKFLNIPNSLKNEINIYPIIIIVLTTFCIQFIAQLINTILTSYQKSALANLTILLGQIGVIITILILESKTKGNLTLLVLTLTTIPTLTLIIVSLYLYSNRLKSIRPSLNYIDWSYGMNILKLGASFFFIQIGSLVLFQTSNIIIAKIIGPIAVTEFNITYKLFSVIIMAFSTIITPYWSAFTDAYAKDDIDWIKLSIKKIRRIWLLVSLVAVPSLILVSNKLYSLWIGEIVIIPFALTVSMGFYTICYTGMSLCCYFLNGISKVKLQKWLYIGACFINIPLGIYLGKYIGAPGVVLANSIVLMMIIIILWIQVDKILNKTARGIWVD